MSFKDYILLMLGMGEVKLTEVPKIRRIKRGGKVEPNKKNEEQLDRYEPVVVISKIVTIVTWFMVIASILSLGAIILFPIIEKETPSILSQLLLVTMGYLGGVLASYMRFMMPGKKSK